MITFGPKGFSHSIGDPCNFAKPEIARGGGARPPVPGDDLQDRGLRVLFHPKPHFFNPASLSETSGAVQIPFHPEIMKRLAELPRDNEYILGLPPEKRRNKSFHRYFGDLPDGLGIVADARGIVNFNCFRNSFITRCDEYGLPRRATRGIVGQVNEETTDLYSHDLTTARRVQSFPAVKLD